MSEFGNIVDEFLSRYHKLDAKVEDRQHEDERAIISLNLSNIFRKFVQPVHFILISAKYLEHLKATRPREIIKPVLEGLDRKDWAGLVPILISGPGQVTPAVEFAKEAFIAREYPILKADAFLRRDAAEKLIKTIFLDNVSIERLSPYAIGTAASSTMFYGRESILKQLLQKTGNVFIFGPRRIGKSSLAFQFREQSGYIKQVSGSSARLQSIPRCSYVDVSTVVYHSTNAIWQAILRGFGLKRQDFAAAGRYADWSASRHELRNAPIDEAKALRHFLSKHSGKLTIMLDEVDGWIQRDAANRWRGFDLLRSITDVGQVQLILIGYESLALAERSYSFPLHGRGELVSLPPLTRRDTEQLILEPINELEIALYSERQVVERIWIESKGMPSIVQDICGRLVRDMFNKGSDERRVLAHDLTVAMAHSDALRRYQTGTLNTGYPLAEAIAGITSFEDEDLEEVRKQQAPVPALIGSIGPVHSTSDILKVLEAAGYTYDEEEFDLALMNLELRYILRMDLNGNYWYWINKGARKKAVARILGIGIERWIASKMRKFKEGDWRAMYEELGYF